MKKFMCTKEVVIKVLTYGSSSTIQESDWYFYEHTLIQLTLMLTDAWMDNKYYKQWLLPQI